MTIEANPETVTAGLAELLAESGITRVSLGVQSFQPGLLEVLERRAEPDDVRRAIYHLRDAQIDNISLDLIYGIPGQEPSDLERDLDEALALEPDHLSCYELEAKPGTRFTHAHGDELARQAEAMEGYFERVVERLVARRISLVRDGQLLPARAPVQTQPGATGSDGTTSGSASARSRRSKASDGGTPRASAAYLRALEDATGAGERARADRRRHASPGAAHARAPPRRARAVRGRGRGASTTRRSSGSSGSVSPSGAPDGLILTRRGRFLGGAVTVELLEESLEMATLLTNDAGAAEPHAHDAAGGDPRARRRGIRVDRVPGRLQEARRERAHRGVRLHGSERARGARGAGAPHASAHLGGACPDRDRLPLLRRPACSSASSRSRPSSCSTSPSAAARSTRRSRRRRRRSRS